VIALLVSLGLAVASVDGAAAERVARQTYCVAVADAAYRVAYADGRTEDQANDHYAEVMGMCQEDVGSVRLVTP
jgi:hypothetical protein